MNFSRRTFLGSLAAAVALPRRLRAETPVAKVGILSDTHVSADPKTVEPLLKAFRRFAAEGVGTVVISGDVCDVGTLAELKSVMDAWHEAFPDGKNAQGMTVDPVFVWGNHDYHAASRLRGKPVTDEDRKNHILYNKDVAWKMVTGEERMPGEIFLKKSHGLVFIGAHWRQQNEIGAFLKEHAAEIPSDRPVIYVQHPHPKDTCFHGWATYDNGKNHDILMAHPNFFCVSGHSHVSVSLDDSLWLGGFAAMGAGSSRIAGGRRDVYNTGVRKSSGVTRHMSAPSSGGAQQSSILTVYRDHVVLSRYEHKYGEPLGEDWDIPFPFPHDAAKPYFIAEAAAAPEFPAGAAIEVAQTDGFLFPDKTPEKQVQLTFPSASSVGPHSRVMRYRVVVAKSDGVVVIERLVSPAFLCLSERRTLKEPAVCAFGLDELPRGEKLVATVTPLNAGSKGGKPIQKEFTI